MNVMMPGKVRWFGEFEAQAVAADSNELASAIEDYIRDYPLARGHRDGRRYVLQMAPLGRRMHQVSVEPSAPDGAILEARIPVGRPVSRRAQLSTIGWALERESSGTRYYTRRFIASEAAPTDIVTAVDEANQVLYGSRANDVRWSLSVLPLYIENEARDGGTMSRRANRPEPAAGTSRRASWSFRLVLSCGLVFFAIGGILSIGAFYVLVTVGVQRFLEWPIGYLVARLLIGLLGLAMVGLGSNALYKVFTGRPIAGEYSNAQIVLASLFSVLLGLAFIVLMVVPWDTEGF